MILSNITNKRKHLASPGAFLLEIVKVEKTRENRLKDYRRITGKKWVDIPTKFEKRVSGSGVQFGGKYVKT